MGHDFICTVIVAASEDRPNSFVSYPSQHPTVMGTGAAPMFGMGEATVSALGANSGDLVGRRTDGRFGRKGQGRGRIDTCSVGQGNRHLLKDIEVRSNGGDEQDQLNDNRADFQPHGWPPRPDAHSKIAAKSRRQVSWAQTQSSFRHKYAQTSMPTKAPIDRKWKNAPMATQAAVTVPAMFRYTRMTATIGTNRCPARLGGIV